MYVSPVSANALGTDFLVDSEQLPFIHLFTRPNVLGLQELKPKGIFCFAAFFSACKCKLNGSIPLLFHQHCFYLVLHLLKSNTSPCVSVDAKGRANKGNVPAQEVAGKVRFKRPSIISTRIGRWWRFTTVIRGLIDATIINGRSTSTLVT